MAPHAVDRLSEELEANRAMFVALCRALTGELARPVPGGHWSVGDHIAHIAAYDRLAIHHLASRVVGMDPRPQMDSDGWNESEVRQRAGRTLPALLSEMGESRAGAMALLTAVSEPDLQRHVWFPGDARRAAGDVPLRLWLERWSKHDMIHARDLLRALPALGTNRDFQSWLSGDPLLEALARAEAGPRDG